jgi:hypothetical protein
MASENILKGYAQSLRQLRDGRACQYVTISIHIFHTSVSNKYQSKSLVSSSSMNMISFVIQESKSGTADPTSPRFDASFFMYLGFDIFPVHICANPIPTSTNTLFTSQIIYSHLQKITNTSPRNSHAQNRCRRDSKKEFIPNYSNLHLSQNQKTKRTLASPIRQMAGDIQLSSQKMSLPGGVQQKTHDALCG